MKTLPNRVLIESDYLKIQELNVLNAKAKMYITDSSKHEKFLSFVTNKLAFNGSEDFNHTIKSYVSRVFRFKVDESLIKQFLFQKIPKTDGAENNYDRLWSCFSNYNEFRTEDPFFY